MTLHRKPHHNWEPKEKKLETKLQQTAEEKQIGFDPECTWNRLNREQRRKLIYHWEKETWRTTQISTEEHKCYKRKMMWLHCAI